jgi:hypothetical protein
MIVASTKETIVHYVISQEVRYFTGVTIVGAVLLVLGQSWALGVVGGGGAGVVAFALSGLLKHGRTSQSGSRWG